MASHHRLALPVQVPKHVFDSCQSTIHGDTPRTGVKVLGSPDWALQAVSAISLSGRGAEERAGVIADLI